jgi:hypothetical protein
MKRLVLSLTLFGFSTAFAGWGEESTSVPVEEAAAKGGEAAKDKAKREQDLKARAEKQAASKK